MEISRLSLQDLPTELIIQIAAAAGHKTYLPIMLLNSWFYQCLKGNLLYLFGIGRESRSFREKSGFVAHPEQVKMLLALKFATSTWNMIRAPMGCGKTAVMIMTALESKGRSAFLINTRVYTSWIQEFKNFGMKLVQDPEKSDLLVVHTKYPKHRKYFLERMYQQDGIKGKKIVVTTFYYLRKYSVCFRAWTSGGWVTRNSNVVYPRSHRNYGCLIMDEAHLFKKPDLRIFHPFDRIRYYLFSASPINLPVGWVSRRDIFRYTVKSDSRGYPKLSFKRLELQFPLLTTCYILSMVATIKKKNFAYKNIVIFTAIGTKQLRKYASDMQPELPKWKIYTFSNTAPTILERWKKAEKGILLCNYQTSAEGTNFSEADCIFLYNFQVISLEKARQSLGRVRRKNNVHSKVRAYFFEEKRNDVEWIRGRLNQQYAIYLKKGLFYKKSKNTTLNIIRVLMKDGYFIRKLSDEDLLAIFSYGHTTKPDIRLDDLTISLGEILCYSQM